MKFLILAKPRVVAPALDNPIAAFQAAKEYLNAMVADGRLDCVYNFATGEGGVTIVNADSHEELWEMLMAYPLHRIVEYEIHPLIDVNHFFDKTIERRQKRAGG